MDKLKIAVFLNNNYNPTTGGGFSYYERLIEKIDLYDFDENIEICFLSKAEIDTKIFRKRVVQIPYYKFNSKYWSFEYKVLNKIFSTSILKYFKVHEKIKTDVANKIKTEVTNFLKTNKIDLIYYLNPNMNAINYPFIATHWDLGHKSMFAFPEVSYYDKFDKREFYHRIKLQKAFAIFTESEQSKKELIEFEGINEERIFVVPLFAGKVVELNVNDVDQNIILNKWQLKKDSFYFYPAQFWAHKNHFGLIMAFKIVLEKYPNLKLILSGADKNNSSYIRALVVNNNLENNIIFTGFVSNEEIFTYYKNAIALVMPTYLGPTNMPLLEAYYLGCSVLCSDLEGHKEQMKDRAIYFNPKDYNDIAQKMISIIGTKTHTNIDSENLNIGNIINQNFNSLYNIRKTFGYDN